MCVYAMCVKQTLAHIRRCYTNKRANPVPALLFAVLLHFIAAMRDPGERTSYTVCKRHREHAMDKRGTHGMCRPP